MFRSRVHVDNLPPLEEELRIMMATETGRRPVEGERGEGGEEGEQGSGCPVSFFLRSETTSSGDILPEALKLRVCARKERRLAKASATVALQKAAALRGKSSGECQCRGSRSTAIVLMKRDTGTPSKAYVRKAPATV